MFIDLSITLLATVPPNDSRWLIVAGIFLLSFGGTWRTIRRLKVGIALGLITPSAKRLLRRLQLFRWGAPLFSGIAIYCYAAGRPFQIGMSNGWWWVGVYTAVVVVFLSDALRILNTDHHTE